MHVASDLESSYYYVFDDRYLYSLDPFVFYFHTFILNESAYLVLNYYVFHVDELMDV